MNKITKIREEIAGKQIDLTIYGKMCKLSEEDKRTIQRSVKRGVRRGQLGVMQPGRATRVWTTWSIPFEEVNVGDTVEFSTSGKYNPGFTSTYKYIGKVIKIEKGDYTIAVLDKAGQAIVPLKHIERVL